MATRGRVLTDAEKLSRLLQPSPKFLISRPRQLIRHGELVYFSINTMSKKPRYFWLFNDCLLVTKRFSAQRFQLQIVVHFSPGISVVTMPESSNYEFRLLCPEQGTLAKAKARRVVMWGKNREHKEAWVKDLIHCLWLSAGMRGPDPSLGPAPLHNAKDEEEEMRHMMKEASLRTDRRPSDSDREHRPRRPSDDYSRPQGVGEGRGGNPFAAAKGGRGGGQAPPTRPPPHEVEGDEYYEDDGSDEGEGEGEEQWRSDTGARNDPLISFEEDFPQSSGQQYDSHLQQGGYQHPSGAAMAPLGGGFPQQQQQQSGPSAHGGYPTGSAAYAPAAGQQGQGYQQRDQYYGASPFAAPQHQSDPYYATGQQAYQGGYAQLPTGGGTGAYAAGPGQQPSAYSQTGWGPSGALDYQQAYAGNPQSLQAQTPSAYSPDLPARSDNYGTTEPDFAYGAPPAGATGSSSATTTNNRSPDTSSSQADEFARKELLEASKVVEGLTLQLSSQKSRGTATAFGDASESVLDDTQVIARACTVLLSAASVAQGERKGSAASSEAAYHADPQWAQGLVSAARYVVASLHHLFATTRQYVSADGSIGDEAVGASAGSVNAATAQLLAAFRGRYSSPGSQLGLEEAAKTITSATQKLVLDAKAATDQVGSRSGGAVAVQAPAIDPSSKYSLTQRQVKEIEAQARIMKLEKEAEAARHELLRLRKAEYGGQ